MITTVVMIINDYCVRGTRTQPLICVGWSVHYWVTCAINKGGFFEIAFSFVVFDTHLPRFEAPALPRCEARRRHLIMTCDIFGTTGQTNTLILCYLLGKTYKPAHSSATHESLKSTRSNKLLEKFNIDVSRTHIPLKALTGFGRSLNWKLLKQ